MLSSLFHPQLSSKMFLQVDLHDAFPQYVHYLKQLLESRVTCGQYIQDAGSLAVYPAHSSSDF